MRPLKDRGNATGLIFSTRQRNCAGKYESRRDSRLMTRISNTSNQAGYADSLSFIICNLKAGSTTTAETFSGNGTGPDATGQWSDTNRWFVHAHLRAEQRRELISIST